LSENHIEGMQIVGVSYIEDKNWGCKPSTSSLDFRTQLLEDADDALQTNQMLESCRTLTKVTTLEILHGGHGTALAKNQTLLIIPLLLIARIHMPLRLVQMSPQHGTQCHALFAQQAQEELVLSA